MASAVKLKKGGSARLIINGFLDNDYVTIPAGFRLDTVLVKKVGTVAGNLTLGTTDGGNEVANLIALGGTAGALVQPTLKLNNFAVDTKIYITLSAAGASSNIAFQIQKIL